MTVTGETRGRTGATVESQRTPARFRPTQAELGWGTLKAGEDVKLRAGHPPLPSGTAVYTSSGLSYYRHSDWLGSSRFASTTARTMYSSSAYAPYGEPYAESGTRDRNFTGQNEDVATGSYDFLFRRLNNIQGRWISPDPLGLGAVDPSNPQSWNRYAYALNHGLSYVDPLGLDVFAIGNCYFDRIDYYVDGEYQGTDIDFIGCAGGGGGGGPDVGGGDGDGGGGGGYYVQIIDDCVIKNSGFRVTTYRLMKDGQPSDDFFIQEQIIESYSPGLRQRLFGPGPTVGGGQGDKKGLYVDKASIHANDAPRTLVQSFYISPYATNSRLLPSKSVQVPIVGPLANGSIAALLSQTVVKDGRIYLRGTLASKICPGSTTEYGE